MVSFAGRSVVDREVCVFYSDSLELRCVSRQQAPLQRRTQEILLSKSERAYVLEGAKSLAEVVVFVSARAEIQALSRASHRELHSARVRSGLCQRK